MENNATSLAVTRRLNSACHLRSPDAGNRTPGFEFPGLSSSSFTPVERLSWIMDILFWY